MLRSQGLRVGKERAHRLYQQAGMSLYRRPSKPRIKRRYQALLPPERINEGWAMDFLSEIVINQGRSSVRVINVMDECSRRDLWVEAATSIRAKRLTEILDHLVALRGIPHYIRTDNGPAFISEELENWAKAKGVELRFIQPGKPTQNGLIERLNGTLRRECLNLHWFYSLEEMNEYLQDWYQVYNFERPHSSIGFVSPQQYELNNKHLYFRMVAPQEG
ncbi:MAG: IS3 family transposase [Bacteroidia bacterium]|nr:IS3 family transposase [Bacteroidia bacterium]